MARDDEADGIVRGMRVRNVTDKAAGGAHFSHCMVLRLVK